MTQNRIDQVVASEHHAPESKRTLAWISEGFVLGLVSVIIPTYNCRRYLADAINSVAAQTYRPLEVIVVDDGSTDDTRELVQKWRSLCYEHNRLEIRYFYQQKRGPSSARNKGLLESRGEYVQFLDADDILSPPKIESQIAALSSHTDKRLVAYGPWRHFVLTKNHVQLYEPQLCINDEDPLKEWIGGWFAPPVALLWRRGDIQKTGPFDEGLTADEDGEYALRFLGTGGKLVYCEDAWSFYRQDPNFAVSATAMSRQRTASSVRCRIRVTRRIELHLSSRNLLNDEYRDALSRRYYGIAKDFTLGHKVLKAYCLKNFRRLSPDGRIPGTRRHRMLASLFGFGFTQKLRLWVIGKLHLPTRFPVNVAATIDELWGAGTGGHSHVKI